MEKALEECCAEGNLLCCEGRGKRVEENYMVNRDYLHSQVPHHFAYDGGNGFLDDRRKRSNFAKLRDFYHQENKGFFGDNFKRSPKYALTDFSGQEYNGFFGSKRKRFYHDNIADYSHQEDPGFFGVRRAFSPSNEK